ncbi:TIGR00366 family protein [Nocardioides panacisoli]|uniref:short-chain fatty acid transporter n=1 Tax=Nocardioides panacisoli TaxID=627624 RepID=UPI001C626E5E|nr:TIGR00366 family protein [Nocardioides panacisoli]QYJ03245.1 TIGR00366 family protein [Nocardioides panacisoli]
MLSTLSRPLSRFVERWIPGPLALAVVLTAVVAVMALTMTDASADEVVLAWGDGLTGLLAFMTQVALVLLLGYSLANVRPVHRLLIKVASLPRSPRQAYGFLALVGGIASLISFGLGLIVAGVMAVEVSRVFRDRGRPLHYPLLVAAGYSGFVVWHMGYSGSGPLNAATDGGAYTDLPGGIVPVAETTFSSWNIIATIVTLAVVTVAMMALAPSRDEEVVAAPDAVYDEKAEADVPAATDHEVEKTPADRVDTFRGVTLIAGVFMSLYLVLFFYNNGFTLNLDLVNWTFLALILLLVGNAKELAELIARGGRTVGEVLLQYPLYAGIIGMMGATGLVEIISEFFIDISSPGTLGLLAFLSAGLLNMFVPSGGGQFALMAPLFAGAADSQGVDQSVVIMAIAYGDQWTNMIQPFWAVPLLAVAGLRVRDILGYTFVTLILSGVVFAGTLLVLGAG